MPNPADISQAQLLMSRRYAGPNKEILLCPPAVYILKIILKNYNQAFGYHV